MKNELIYLVLIAFLSACNNTSDSNKKVVKGEVEMFYDESFDNFKTKLQQAVKHKNLVALKPLFADSIMESNDGCGYPGCSQDEFFEIYFTTDTSDDWDIAKAIVSFGFETGNQQYHNLDTLSAYYVAPAYSDSSFNPEKEIYIIREWTYIYEKPTASSKPVTKAVYNERLDCICDYSRDDAYITHNDTTWIKVKVPGMKYGYTPLQHTSNFISKYMLVKKINGRWSIVEYYDTPGC